MSKSEIMPSALSANESAKEIEAVAKAIVRGEGICHPESPNDNSPNGMQWGLFTAEAAEVLAALGTLGWGAQRDPELDRLRLQKRLEKIQRGFEDEFVSDDDVAWMASTLHSLLKETPFVEIARLISELHADHERHRALNEAVIPFVVRAEMIPETAKGTDGWSIEINVSDWRRLRTTYLERESGEDDQSP